MTGRAPSRAFWAGRRILVTGHTGFKGAWAVLWLARLGAKVHGLSLPAETEPSLWREVGNGLLSSEYLCDLADRDVLNAAVKEVRPEIVIHMAAQALVRRSYAAPVETIVTNTLGTAYLLEALREVTELKAVLIVTTDKVYANNENGKDFVEDDRLGGHDPYSASKAAAELITQSFAASFFEPRGVPVATARAGNVVGGGDWSEDRLVPDVWRAARAGTQLILRYPHATRPWQHVLEPLAGYFLYLEALANDATVPRSLNFGPNPGTLLTVATVADAIGRALGIEHTWRLDDGLRPQEMQTLSIDPGLAKRSLGWRPRLSSTATIDWTARWYDQHRYVPASALCNSQIQQYEAMLKND